MVQTRDLEMYLDLSPKSEVNGVKEQNPSKKTEFNSDFKNHKGKKKITKLLLIIGIVLFSNSVFAQKNMWTINLNTSMQGQKNVAIEHEYEYFGINSWGWLDPKMRTTRTLSNVPLLELTGRYNITNHFSIASGIGHRSYITTLIPRIPPTIITGRYDWLRSDYLYLPLTFQFDVPLKNTGFSFFAQLGLNLNFLITTYGADEIPDNIIGEEFSYYDYQNNKLYDAVYFSDAYSPERILLFHTGLGFSYQFKSGVGISLSGKYNMGTSQKRLLSYWVHLEDPNNHNIGRIVDYNIYSKMECWNVSFGVSYTFKKKIKEKNINATTE